MGRKAAKVRGSPKHSREILRATAALRCNENRHASGRVIDVLEAQNPSEEAWMIHVGADLSPQILLHDGLGRKRAGVERAGST